MCEDCNDILLRDEVLVGEEVFKGEGGCFKGEGEGEREGSSSETPPKTADGLAGEPSTLLFAFSALS